VPFELHGTQGRETKKCAQVEVTENGSRAAEGCRHFSSSSSSRPSYTPSSSEKGGRNHVETAGSIDVDEVMKVFDDSDFTWGRYYVPNANLGGLETYGIGHFLLHFVPYGEIIDG